MGTIPLHHNPPYTYTECDYAGCGCYLAPETCLHMNEGQMIQPCPPMEVATTLPSPPTSRRESTHPDLYSGSMITDAIFQDQLFTCISSLRKERRKIQNRKAQQAYRNRKDKHMHALEQELNAANDKLSQVSKNYDDVKSQNTVLMRLVEELQSRLCETSSAASGESFSSLSSLMSSNGSNHHQHHHHHHNRHGRAELAASLREGANLHGYGEKAVADGSALSDASTIARSVRVGSEDRKLQFDTDFSRLLSCMGNPED